MQDLQIRRRWVDRNGIAPSRDCRDCGEGHFDPEQGDSWQINVKVNRLLIIEGNLAALAARAVRRRCFVPAMAIRVATVLRALEHEVLFARNATAPNHGCDEEQRKKRTGQCATHDSKTNDTTILQPLTALPSGARHRSDGMAAGLFLRARNTSTATSKITGRTAAPPN